MLPISPETSAAAPSTRTSHDPRSALTLLAGTRLLRAAVVLLAGTAAFACPQTAHAATSDGGVRITINGTPGRYLSHADVLDAADQAPDYATYRHNGVTGDPYLAGGTTAAAIVQLARVGLPALTSMTVTFDGYGGAPVQLSRDDVENGLFGDPMGHTPRYATFDAGIDSEVHFFQPLRTSDPNEDTPRLDPPTRRDLKVDLETTGHPLNVTLTPSTTQIDPGHSVSFNTQVTPAPNDPDTTYDWDFEGDGQTESHGPGAPHTYATAGNYSARVTVTSSDGSSGTDAVAIQVGDPASNTPPAPPPPGAPSGPAGPAGASPGAGGGTAGKRAPAHGPTHAHKSAIAEGKTAKKSSHSKHAKTAKPSVSATSSPTPGTQPTGPGSRRAGGGKRTSSGAQPEPTQKLKPTSPAAHGSGVRISGVLFADTSAFVSQLPKLTASAADPLARSAARATAGTPGGVLSWVVGILLCIAVPLSGAMTEMRALARHAVPSTS